MPWKYHSEDGKIEVVVEPEFKGDLVGLARVRPVWIVDSEQNRSIIDASWLIGKEANLFEVSRCQVSDPIDREGNLLSIMGDLDDHQGTYDLIVHGLQLNEGIERTLKEEGFRIAEAKPDGFVALRIPEVRHRLIGRDRGPARATGG